MTKLLATAVFALFLSTSNSVFAGGTSDHDHSDSNNHGGSRFSVGEPANANIDRTISVSMLDSMRFVFTPSFEELHDGEVIEFIVKNDGSIVHEFSIGNAEDQIKHAEMMRKMPGMKHNDPNTASLEPGETAKLIWRFKGDDTVVFACNEPGHFEAGMRHDLKIEDTGHSH